MSIDFKNVFFSTTILIFGLSPVFGQVSPNDSLSSIQIDSNEAFSVQEFLNRLDTTEFNQKTIDELIHVAKEHAFSKNYPVAINLCELILDYNPDYHDARLIIARTHAWSKEFEQARLHVEKVYAMDSLYEPANFLIINIEFWDGNLKKALNHANFYIENHPTNRDVLMTRIKILLNLKYNDKALKYLRYYAKIYPKDNDAKKMIDELRKAYFPNRLNVLYTQHNYDYTQVDNGVNEVFIRRMVTTEWENRHYMGSIIGRLNIASFRGYTGFQGEVDWYPEFKNGDYAYFNGGLAIGRAFPIVRMGFEYYHSFLKKMEISGGFRNLNFKGNSVVIFTGALGSYFGSYYFSVRPYLIPKSNEYGRTLDFTVRKYFQNADNYIGLNYGFGLSPDDGTYWYIDDALESNRNYLDNPSEKIAFNFRKNLMARWLVKFDAQYERQKLYNAALQKNLVIISFMGGVSYAF